MRKVLHALLKLIAGAGVFVAFFVGLFGAAAVVSGLRILDEDFVIVFAFPTMIVGGVAMAWFFRKGFPKPPVGYLPPAALLLLMGAVPATVAVINVKLDRSPPRRHTASVIYAETRADRSHCAVQEETLGTIWITLPPGEKAGKGSSVVIVTRPGFLGFPWIEGVGSEARVPAPSPPVEK